MAMILTWQRGGGRARAPARRRHSGFEELNETKPLRKRRLDREQRVRYAGCDGISGAGMLSYFWIAVGSALGGMARQWCSVMAVRLWPVEFPWGTVGINIVGSFVIGLFAALTGEHGRLSLPLVARQFVSVGLCGGFTTFSSFSRQTMVLINDWRLVEAGANILLSVTLCLASVAAGYELGGIG